MSDSPETPSQPIAVTACPPGLPPEDWFFLLGLVIATGLVIFHRDATTIAGLVAAHKGISVADGKFRDK